MASERLAVCQALAAMIRSHGDPNEEEITFVGHAAFDLGLTQEENEAVQNTLKNGGDFAGILPEVSSKPMRIYLFRRVVAAALLDQQINEQERAFIDRTGDAFGYQKDIVEEVIRWMQDGIAWENRGADLLGRL